MSNAMAKIEAAQEARTEALRKVEAAERAIVSRVESLGGLEAAIADLCEGTGIRDHYNATAAPADFREGRTTREMIDHCVKRKQADANKSEGWAFRSLAQDAESLSTAEMERAQAARSEKAWAAGMSGGAMDRAEAINSLETQLYDYRKAQTAHRRDPDSAAPARMPKGLEKALARKAVANFEQSPDRAMFLYKAVSTADIAEMGRLVDSLSEANGVAARASGKVRHLQKGLRVQFEKAAAGAQEPQYARDPSQGKSR